MNLLYALMMSVSYAQSAPTGVPGAAKQPGTLEMLLPFVVIFAIFYFLIIRPQVKRQKDHQKFVTELKKGDEVLTNGGILGTIEGLTDQFVTLEVSQGVRIRVLRSQISTTMAAQQAIQKQEEKK
jgi:preprotein translocase subunit YajC